MKMILNNNLLVIDKKYRKLLFAVILLFASSCYSTPVQKNAIIFFEKLQHDFGSIPYNNKTFHSFEFSNPGKVPLLINDIKASCGCTAVEWNKEPIKPGKSGKIQVQYDAASPGAFSKEITVYYNGAGSPAVLKIRGQVEYPDM